MRFVIAGAGAVGSSLATTLRLQDEDVAVIDHNAEALARLERLDIQTVHGHAASSEVLRKARIAEARAFFGVTDGDETNIVAGSVASLGGCEWVGARVNNASLIDVPISTAFEDLGVDVAISPDLVTAAHLARLLRLPGALNLAILGGGKVQALEGRVRAGGPLAGQSVSDVKLPEGSLVVAIFRGHAVVLPRGDTRIQPGDRVVLLAPTDLGEGRVQEILSGVRRHPHPIEDVFVMGNTRIAEALAATLAEEAYGVQLVVPADKAEEVAERMPSRVIVLGGEVGDVSVLQDEDVGPRTALVTAWDREEVNVVACLAAKHRFNIGRTLCVVNTPEYETLSEDAGVDTAVAPRIVAASAFLSAALDQAREEVALFHHGDCQVLLVDLDEGNQLTGKPISKVFVPKGVLVAAVVRHGEVKIPTGDDVLKAGDSVVLFVKTEAVPELHKLF